MTAAAMTPEAFADYALGLPETTEDEPFGPDAMVYRVLGKMFAIVRQGTEERPDWVTLKCEPELAAHLRGQFSGSVLPGYHMNKRYWITVLLDGSVPDEEIKEMADHSYDQVVAAMPRAERERLRFARLRADL
ncbi:MmcQ/YjbR family DNA-binding protein [Kitasatospora sp. NPDC054939]